MQQVHFIHVLGKHLKWAFRHFNKMHPNPFKIYLKKLIWPDVELKTTLNKVKTKVLTFEKAQSKNFIYVNFVIETFTILSLSHCMVNK